MTDCFLFSFLVWGIGGVALCCCGYAGNLLSLIALQRDTRAPATTLLQALAVSDLVLLTSVCVTDFVPRICDYTLSCSNVWKVWPQVRFLWLLVPVSHMCSIWLAVLIAGNRYWAVCRPLDAGQVWTNRRTWTYIACVVCSVVVFNVPRIFEYQIVATPINGTRTAWDGIAPGDAHATGKPLYQNVEIGNKMADFKMADYLETTTSFDSSRPEETQPFEAEGTGNVFDDAMENPHSTRVVKDGVSYKESKTHFGETVGYRIAYKVVLVNSLLILFPLGFLLVSSVWVIRSLRLTNANSMVKRKSKTPGSPGADDRRSNPSREVTFLLTTVVLVAVACQTPLAVFHIVRYLYKNKCGDTVFYLENISKFLVSLNACVNFVIYCILGPRFRRLLVLAVTCTPRGKTRGRLASRGVGAGEIEMLKERDDEVK